MSDKPSLPRDGTMAVTAKIGKDFLGNEKLGDTRLVTNQIKKSKKGLKKNTTVSKTIAEAKELLGKDYKLAEISTERTLRVRAPRPVSAKPAGSKRPAKSAKGSGGKKAKKAEPAPAIST